MLKDEDILEATKPNKQYIFKFKQLTKTDNGKNLFLIIYKTQQYIALLCLHQF